MKNLLKYVSNSVALLRPIIDKVVEINVEGLNRNYC
jgi:hypothetical protein